VVTLSTSPTYTGEGFELRHTDLRLVASARRDFDRQPEPRPGRSPALEGGSRAHRLSRIADRCTGWDGTWSGQKIPLASKGRARPEGGTGRYR
jgi:hypothetical protein